MYPYAMTLLNPPLVSTDTVCLYRMSGYFMSVLQNLIPEVIPSQKCHINMDPILNGYRAVDIWYSR
jgi:hypothetical protein